MARRTEDRYYVLIHDDYARLFIHCKNCADTAFIGDVLESSAKSFPGRLKYFFSSSARFARFFRRHYACMRELEDKEEE